MNMPPECEWDTCRKAAMWMVHNKTKGSHKEACHEHVACFLENGCTHVVYPSKDYSKEGRGGK